MMDAESSIRSYICKALGFETLEDCEAFEDRLAQHGELMEALRDDWCYVSGILEPTTWEDEEQLQRRIMVRTLFAWIEGTVHALKRQVLEYYTEGRIELSQAEYAILREESYRLKDSGKTHAATTYPRTLPNVKFTFPIYARTWGITFEFTPPLNQDPRWQSLCQAYEVRNRLTHPKSAADLTVSDVELEKVKEASRWFVDQLARIESFLFEFLREIGKDQE
jgi:hypothetical protein